MNKEDLLKFDFVKEECNGCYGIYPQKANNTYVLNKVLLELQKTHKLYKIFDDYIRAIEI